MNNMVSGSTILSILILTTIILISMTTIIHSISYMLIIARMSEQHEQQYYAAEGLLNYGIEWAVENKKEYEKSSTPIIIEMGKWPSEIEDHFKGIIKIISVSPILHIQSLLSKNGQLVCSLACQLHNQKDNSVTGNRGNGQFITSNFQQTFFKV